MSLLAIPKVSAADQVFARLLAEIVHGQQPAGSHLPAERKLSEQMGVHRHVVREALKRLAQSGLVRITPGGFTEVLDFHQSAGLDILGVLSQHGLPASQLLNHWRSTLEMRAAIATDAARLCALRGDSDVRLALPALTLQMQHTHDDQALYALELRYWDTVITGADNLAYRLAFNSLMKILAWSMGPPSAQEDQAAFDINRQVVRAWVLHGVHKTQCHRALSEAIAESDADAAEAETRTLMRKGLQSYERFMQAWQAMPAPDGHPR